MPDQELQILIRTLAETYGLDQVNRELKRFKDETGESGKELEKHNTHHREMHRLFRELNVLLPGTGHLLHGLFSPELLGIAGGTAALGIMVELFRKAGEAAKEAAAEAKEHADRMADMYDKVTTGVENLVKAAGDANQALVQSFRDIDKSTETAEKRVQAITSAIDAQRDSTLKLLKAREQLELSQATSEVQRQAIKERFGEQEAMLPIGAEREKARRQQAALEAAKGVTPGLQEAFNAAVSGVSGGPAAEREEQRRVANETLEKATAKLKEAVEKLAESDQFHLISGPDVAKFTQQKATAEEQIKVSKEALTHIEAQDAAAKQRLATAEKQLEDNRKFIVETSAMLADLKAKLNLQTQTAGLEQTLTRGANLVNVTPQVAKQLTETAGTIDMFGFLEAVTKLSTLPAAMMQMRVGINTGMKAVQDANDAINRRIDDMQKKMNYSVPSQ